MWHASLDRPCAVMGRAVGADGEEALPELIPLDGGRASSPEATATSVPAAQSPRHHEADARAGVVDRAGLVVDQAALLRPRHQVHLVHVAVVAALAGEDPEVAGVAQPGAVVDERLLALLARLDHDDRAVELAGPHQAAAQHVLDL